ncbi:MAG: 30S ribosomal protein S17 [Anaerolineae bacterium]|nr:30S ribosomal protein S17 [Anaerolineae bacterium]
MPNNRRRLEGRVVSNKMDKTVVVAIERRKMHPIYKKVVRTTKTIMAHDESNALEIGALVRVVESKPLSRRKRWVVEAVLQAEAAPVLETLPDEEGLIGGAAESDDEVETDDAEAGEGDEE